MDSEKLQTLSRVERVEFLFGFEAFDYQADLIQQGDENDVAKAAVKPGRQVGKTLTGGAIAAERALSGHDVMILGPFEDTVREMMEAATGHLLNVEEEYGDGILGTDQRNKTDWQFSVAGRLRARTVGTDGTQIRGKNPDVVLVDEAAYIKDGIFQEVIEPFFSTHETYEYYLFSTPAGKSGYFYDKVESDDSFYSPHWPSRISPQISEEWLADKREELDSLTYAQEYEGEFVDEGDSLFPHDIVKPLVGETELSETRWLGVDIAREGRDRTVYTEVDNQGHVRIAAVEEKSTMDGVLGQIKALHRENQYEQIIVEENSIGGGVIDFGEGMGDVLVPFKSSTKSKHKLYKRLQKDVESGELSLPNDRRLINELTSLQYSFTQHGYMKVHHPDGGHDDYPDSLAFANWGRNGEATGKKVNRRSARVNMKRGNL